MQCKAIHKKLIFYLEGDLPAREAENVASHLGQCNDCAAFAEDLKKTLGVVELEKSPEVNPYFYTRLKARMENQHSTARQTVGLPVWQKVLQPAVFTLLLLAGIYSGIKIGQPAQTESPEFSAAQTALIPYLDEMKAEPIEIFLME